MSDKVKGPASGPIGYNAGHAPSSAELKAPVKVYPGASKLPKTGSGKSLDGPGCNSVYSK